MQQLLVWQFPGTGPLINILLAVPVTLVMAVLSWKLVEARAIFAFNPLTDWIAQFFRLPANGAGQSL